MNSKTANVAFVIAVQAVLTVACGTPTGGSKDSLASVRAAESPAPPQPAPCAQSEPTVAGSTSQTSCGVHAVVSYPLGIPLTSVVIGASDSVSLEHDVEVAPSSGTARSVISNLGGGDARFATGDNLAVDVWSSGDVRLDGSFQITGSVHSAARVQGNKHDVENGIYEHVQVGPDEPVNWVVPFPLVPGPDRTVAAGQHLSLPSGSVGNLHVAKGGTLSLAAGTYYLESFAVDTGAAVIADSTLGAVIVNVRSQMASSAPWTATTTNGAINVLVAYLGSSPLHVSGGFAGTLFAPNAALELSAGVPNSNGDYRGAFFGKSITVDRGVHIYAASFPSWRDLQALTNGPVPTPPPAPPNPRVLHQPPPLNAVGADATSQVQTFIKWASGAVPAEDGDVSGALTAARQNADIAAAFAVEVDGSLNTDWSRSLLALMLLSSMRAPSAEAYLTSFVNRPLPHTGQVTLGRDAMTKDDLALSDLQAFAVTGLSLLGTASGNTEVLRLATQHPARYVRMEAVRAHLRNGGSQARPQLQAVLSAEDQVLLDRFENRNLNGSTSFDDRLQAFLALYPQQPQANSIQQ